MDKIALIIACLEALIEVLKVDRDGDGSPDIVDLIVALGKKTKKQSGL